MYLDQCLRRTHIFSHVYGATAKTADTFMSAMILVLPCRSVSRMKTTAEKGRNFVENQSINNASITYMGTGLFDCWVRKSTAN